MPSKKLKCIDLIELFPDKFKRRDWGAKGQTDRCCPDCHEGYGPGLMEIKIKGGWGALVCCTIGQDIGRGLLCIK